jgi:hypothetical protein
VARIFARALKLLDRLYEFPGDAQSAPLEFSTESPVQPVHDVSREVELGAIVTNPGAAGIFSLDQDNVHAGGDNIQSFIDPYGTLDATWGKVGARWIWMLRYGATCTLASGGAGSSARLSLGVLALGNALVLRDYLIALWGSSTAQLIKASGSLPAAMTLVGTQSGMPLPIPLPPNCQLGWYTDATAAAPGTMRISMLCWIGPYGVYPPGMM